MFGIVSYAGFLFAAVALCLTPGIDTIYIVTRARARARAVPPTSSRASSTWCLVVWSS